MLEPSYLKTNTKKITAEEIEEVLAGQRDDKQRDLLMRFFKTGKGEYGEGDLFLGLKVPQTRTVVKAARLQVSFAEIRKLLYSPWHEVRLSGFLLLVEEMKVALPKKKDSEDALRQKSKRRKDIADFYLRHARQANNWDLVDLSCQYILGIYVRLSDEKDYTLLYDLAKSDNLWEQRIAIVSTLDLIRNDIFTPTLTLCDLLITHPHDLIHKAIGWMLREVGKKDQTTLTDYLDRNYSLLPRTSLRYAIERLPEPVRQYWLKRKS